jgi:hypothetical protein
MKRIPMHLRPLSLLILALGLILMSMGCDHVTPSEEAPSGEIAAAMAASSQSAATVGENLELVELFAAPMASSVEDLGLDGETDFDPWSGEGADFPELAMLGAQGFRGTANLQVSVATSVTSGRKATQELPQIEWGGPGRAEGDTLSVEHFNSPDSTGLNAVIEGAEPEMIRFVMIRDYPNAGPLQPNHRDSEILIDTQGTMEDNSDDEIHRVEVSEAWANGQVVTGSMLPESGSGPLLPDAVIIATHRTDDPMWHPLQSWFESVVRLEAGEFETEGDEVFHSFTNTVAWINGAEETAGIMAVDEGPIVDGSEVVVSAEFTAAPANGWLESVQDEIRANMGDLDDEADDLLLEIGRTSIFDGVDYEGNSPRAIVSFTPEQPVAVGEEPCGGDYEEEVFYLNDWWVEHLQRQVDIGCDGSGTVHVHMDFADGSSLDRSITWSGGIATLEETRPNGTVVAGTWNENTGDYSVTTTFPAGSDPEQRIQSGNYSDGHMDARDEFIWMDEHEDYTEFSADESEAGWSIAGTRVDGALNETFTLSGSEGELTGSWSREDEGVDASGNFTLTELAGGGAHLVFDAEDLLAEGEPQVSGDLWYEPDGSGHGTVTITQFGNTVTYEIEWSADGEGSLTDGQGNTVPLG